MKFYKLKLDYSFPPVESENHDMASQNLLSYEKISDTTPILPVQVMHKHAPLNDFMDSLGFGGRGFLVSDRVKHILVEFSLPQHIYYPITLRKNKKEISNYFWIHIIMNDEAIVDFPKSEFYWHGVELPDLPFTANSFDEIQERRNRESPMRVLR